MPQTDTELVRGFLAAVGEDRPQADVAALVGVTQQTVSRWRKAATEGRDVSISPAARTGIANYLLRAKGVEFRKGVRLAVKEMRAKLDELEGRLSEGGEPGDLLDDD